MTIAASEQRVWDSLQFYEELATRPLLLRLFLPLARRLQRHLLAAIEQRALESP